MKPTLSVKMTKDDVPRLMKSLKILTSREVYVGVPAEDTEREDENGNKQGITNAALAYIHENGSPAANIEARPFLHPGITDAMPVINQLMRDTAELALKGHDPEPGFTHIGLTAVASIKKKIRSNIPPELGPKTLEARRRRGVYRTHTLVDTGQLLNSITYVVKKTKGAD